MFETLQMAPPDAILGLTEAFKSDPNPQKINLSVGVYKDAQGTTHILEVVKEAERRLLAQETNKILKRVLRDEGWECADPVWLRDGEAYRRLSDQDAKSIRAAFEARGRIGELDR